MTKTNFEDDIAQMHAAVMLSGNGAVQTLDEAISRVVSHRNPRSIGSLLLLLNDSYEHDEGMFSLIHAAESFDDDVYVRELLLVLPEISRSAPRWASIILMRVLNNESARDELVRLLRTASITVKESARWLCEKINERNPKFLNRTLAVLVTTKQEEY